jgi:precorrin-8X/cobalt-precorrin-8 methylmutase
MPAEAHAPTTLLARYGRPPGEVERLSLARLEAQVGSALPKDPGAHHLVRRVLYAGGDPGLAPMVLVHPLAVPAGAAALSEGAPVVVDVSMVAAGLHRNALRRFGCSLVVAIEEPDARRVAIEACITRSAAAFRLLASRLGGAVVAIGNAPTALLELLDLVDAGAPKPAVILGMPVGLVAAAESKAELARRAIPYVTVLGTRGGSPLAAAAVNALLELAGRERAGTDDG